jgi:tight adherence protein B
MGLIVLAFFVMTLLTFAALTFAMRPTSEQKALDKRLTHIKVAPGTVVGDLGGLFLESNEPGSFAWLELIARHFHFSEKLQVLILQSDIDITLAKLMIFSGASGVAGMGLTAIFVSKLWIAALVGVLALFIPILYLKFRRGRRVDAFNAGLADSIDMMARSMRAGHSLVAALGIVAEQAVEPLRFEFGEVFKKQNYGLPIREALMQLLDRVPSQDLRVLVTGMLVQKETGGNLAEILDRIAYVIRERIRIQGEIRTHTAQGRLTGWILCLLPAVMLGLINWINPGYSEVLFNTPTGNKLLGGGIFLLCLGGLVIRQIINGIEV